MCLWNMERLHPDYLRPKGFCAWPGCSYRTIHKQHEGSPGEERILPACKKEAQEYEEKPLLQLCSLCLAVTSPIWLDV